MTDKNSDVPEVVLDEETEEKGVFGPTSFDELDEIREEAEKRQLLREDFNAFQAMTHNVVIDPEIEPRQKGSFIKEIAGEFVDRMAKIFGISTKDGVIPEKDEQPVNKSSFTVYKGEDGRPLWISAYSNNFRDNDNPPEIISAQSHKSFVERVDKGEAELPELWLWHEPNWVIGKATTVAYDEKSGFALAAGYFYEDAEEIAYAIEKSNIVWGVSHGMPSRHMKRSKEDPTIIVEHITTEISPLPWDAAANKLASFTTLSKEENMPVSEQKRQQLVADGIPEDVLDTLEQGNDGKKQLADQLGLESKEEASEESETPEVPEITEDTDAEETKQEDQPEETPTEEQPEEEKETKELPFSEPQMVFLKEFAEGLVDKLSGEIGSIVDEKLEPIKESVEERQKTMEEVVKETIATTPVASLHDLLGGVSLRKMSATESEDTKVDGRTKMARGKPEEAEEAPADLLGSVIGNITSGDYRQPVSQEE